MLLGRNGEGSKDVVRNIENGTGQKSKMDEKMISYHYQDHETNKG
jgi:hypothetical protein